jgi:hypothetical protein
MAKKGGKRVTRLVALTASSLVALTAGCSSSPSLVCCLYVDNGSGPVLVESWSCPTQADYDQCCGVDGLCVSGLPIENGMADGCTRANLPASACTDLPDS